MSQSLTAIVADDEAHLRAHLIDLLSQIWPHLTIVGQAENGLQALEQIQTLAPDIAFLDIKMPGLTGLEVARAVLQARVSSAPQFVFVTAYDQYAVQAFESEAVDYLLKPVERLRLGQTKERLERNQTNTTLPDEIQKLTALLAQLSSATRVNLAATLNEPEVRKTLRWIRASQGDTTYHLDIAQVQFFKSDDKYTVVQSTQGEYVIRKTLSELLNELDPEYFWQIHRGTIINLSYLSKTQRDELGNLTVYLRNYEHGLPVARPYVGKFKQM
jgi:DNA-binding LytR/AlgR family response regulator